MPYIETSVKDCINVDEAFQIAIEKAMLRESEKQSYDQEKPKLIKLTESNNETLSKYSCLC